MMKRIVTVALVGAFTFGAAGVVSAQDTPPTQEKKADEQPAAGQDELPTPPDGWWEKVQGGESAVYEMTQMGMQMKLKFNIDSREGSMITFSTSVEVPGMPQGMPPETHTVDANDPEQIKKNKMPEGSTVKKVGEETLTAAGRDWACTVYEVEGQQGGQQMKMKMWHSAELLPLFNGGAVKMEVEVPGPNGQPMQVRLQLTEVGAGAAGGAATPKGE